MELSAERLGGAVLAANDEFFAEKENLLTARAPVFVEDRYTDRGKWMDGWETRRRREPGYDWAIVRLGLSGILRGVVVNTAHFKGNFPEACSIEACAAPGAATAEELKTRRWVEVVAKRELKGDAQNEFAIENPVRFTHVRLNIYPDGGVARLRVYGEVVPEWPRAGQEVDLAAIENGGRVIEASDMFFGSRHNLVQPGRPSGMHDGWETRRRRGAGNDWVVVRLGSEGTIGRVEVDTTYFKGNAPGACALDGGDGHAWVEVFARAAVRPHTRHFFEEEIAARGPFTHVRLSIFPDGGVARLRVWGELTDEARAGAMLARLNVLTDEEAEAELLRCCGSRAWAREMAHGRPYENPTSLLAAADRVWSGLGRADWIEAFARHPRIGEGAKDGGQARRWSEQEQAGVRGAAGEVLDAMREANREYEAKFGWVYVVCATGRGAEEMLAGCRERMGNEAEHEIAVAAEEQRKITRLRLEKWMNR